MDKGKFLILLDKETAFTVFEGSSNVPALRRRLGTAGYRLQTVHRGLATERDSVSPIFLQHKCDRVSPIFLQYKCGSVSPIFLQYKCDSVSPIFLQYKCDSVSPIFLQYKCGSVSPIFLQYKCDSVSPIFMQYKAKNCRLKQTVVLLFFSLSLSLSLSKYVDSPVRRIEIPTRPLCTPKNASWMHRRNGWILGNANAILTVFRLWALRSVVVETMYVIGTDGEPSSIQEKTKICA